MRRLMQGGKAESLQQQQPPAAMLQYRMWKQRLFCFFPCPKSKHPLPASWCRLFVGQFHLPSPGRKTWVHHHPALRAVPPHKGGVLLSTAPVPVSCLTFKFCARAVQTGWSYGRVFQASFPSTLYGFCCGCCCCMLFFKSCMFRPRSRVIFCLVFPTFPEHLRSCYFFVHSAMLPIRKEVSCRAGHSIFVPSSKLLFASTFIFAIPDENGLCSWCQWHKLHVFSQSSKGIDRAVVTTGINMPYGPYITFLFNICLLQKNYWKQSSQFQSQVFNTKCFFFFPGFLHFVCRGTFVLRLANKKTPQVLKIT